MSTFRAWPLVLLDLAVLKHGSTDVVLEPGAMGSTFVKEACEG